MKVVAFYFVYHRAPETAGRSLEDIEKSLRAGTFLPEVGKARMESASALSG